MIHVIHLACTPNMDDVDFVDMLRLIRMESSPLTSIRRILLGETVDIKFVEVVHKVPSAFVIATDVSPI